MNNDSRSVELDRISEIREELKKSAGEKRQRYGRFTLAALSSIPWAGGFLSAMAARDSEESQRQVNELHQQWLEIYLDKLNDLGDTLAEILARLEALGEISEERLEDDGYLNLVAQAFRVWDQSATEEKRTLIKRLLTNAGATKLSSDDVVRLFIDWIERYHEIHFAVIRCIYRTPGSSRARIWDEISGEDVRDNSPEADLFKLLMRDLSTGSVIRQARPTDGAGRFLRQRPRRSRGPYLMSPFDDEKPYVLTELGRQFVHYSMDETVARIGSSTDSENGE